MKRQAIRSLTLVLVIFFKICLHRQRKQKPNKQIRLNQTYKLLHNEGNHQKKWKGNLLNRRRLFANDVSDKGLISKLYRKNSYDTVAKKKKRSIKIWIDTYPKKTYCWPIDTWKDALDITNCQGNAGQNHSEILPYPYYNDCLSERWK